MDGPSTPVKGNPVCRRRSNPVRFTLESESDFSPSAEDTAASAGTIKRPVTIGMAAATILVSDDDDDAFDRRNVRPATRTSFTPVETNTT